MSEVESSVLYLSVFIVSAICFSRYKSNSVLIQKTGISCSIIIPAIFAGIRYNVGTDYGNYYYTFMRIKELPYIWIFKDNYHLNVERLFLLISKILVSFTNPKVVFGLWSGIIIFLYVYTILKYYREYNLTVAYFNVLTVYYASSFNILRQGIAIVIVFWAMHFIFEHKPYRYFLAVVFASLIHSSAIVGLVSYYLWDHKSNKCISAKKSVGVVFALIVFVVTWQKILLYFAWLPFVHKFYTVYSIGNQGRNLSFIIKLILAIFILMIRKKLIRFDKRINLFVLLFIMGTVFEYTGWYSTFVKRCGWYYSVTEILLLSNVGRIANKDSRVILNCMIILAMLLEFLIIYGFLGQGDIIPYYTR